MTQLTCKHFIWFTTPMTRLRLTDGKFTLTELREHCTPKRNLYFSLCSVLSIPLTRRRYSHTPCICWRKKTPLFYFVLQVTFVPPHVPVHPHIYSNGHICLSILDSDWTPAMNVMSVCLSIQSMLSSAKQKVEGPRTTLVCCLTLWLFCCRSSLKETRGILQEVSLTRRQLSGDSMVCYILICLLCETSFIPR